MNIKVINSYGKYKCRSCGKIILGSNGLYMIIENGAILYECIKCHDENIEKKEKYFM